MARHAFGESVGQVDSRRAPHGHDGNAERTEVLPSRTTDVEASWHRKDKSTLRIRTADGDVVRLKFKSLSSARLSSSTQESDSGVSSEVQLETSQRTRMSMSVRGELDADELAAIQETIARAGEIASDFFSGDVQAAFDSAADFGITSDEIASVRMKMKSSERFTYAAQSATYGPAPTPTAPDLPADAVPSAVVDETPGGAPGGIQAQMPSDAVQAAPAETEPEPVEESHHPDPIEAPQAPTREETVGGLADFLDGLLTRIGADDSNRTLSVGASFSRSISMSLKLRIVESVLVTAAESERPTEPLPDLVSHSIDDLVAQELPPMETVA